MLAQRKPDELWAQDGLKWLAPLHCRTADLDDPEAAQQLLPDPYPAQDHDNHDDDADDDQLGPQVPAREGRSVDLSFRKRE